MPGPTSRIRNRHLPPGPRSRTLIVERALALERYSICDAIAMAIRADRRERGMDQRTYAEVIGMSKSQLARLERDPGGIRLRQILGELTGTRHRLGVFEQVDNDEEVAAPAVVTSAPTPKVANDWPITELMARTSAGARFPAHKVIRRVGWRGPAWFARNYQCWWEPPEGPVWTTEKPTYPIR